MRKGQKGRRGHGQCLADSACLYCVPTTQSCQPAWEAGPSPDPHLGLGQNFLLSAVGVTIGLEVREACEGWLPSPHRHARPGPASTPLLMQPLTTCSYCQTGLPRLIRVLLLQEALCDQPSLL